MFKSLVKQATYGGLKPKWSGESRGTKTPYQGSSLNSETHPTWRGSGSGEKFDRVCKPVYNDSDASYRAVAVRPAQASTHRYTVAAYSHSALDGYRDR